MGPVCSGSFSLPPICRREVLRYAGMKAEAPEISALLTELLAEAEPSLTPLVCWQEFPILRTGERLDLGFTKTDSEALRRNLTGCDQITLFAATLGLPYDRLITRYSRISPAKALLLQALGAERIEALCDTFCQKIRQEAEAAGLHTVPRFSPGYGDFPLEIQAEIFRVLDCPRRIGLTLNESLLMSPSKSVTALVGMGTGPCRQHSTGCQACTKTDCIYRRIP